MASYFNTAGSRVTVVELQEQIGGEIDADPAQILLHNLRKQGIEFHLATKVTRSGKGPFRWPRKTEQKRSLREGALSVGRRPSLDGLGLEDRYPTGTGRLQIDEYGRCDRSGVCGWGCYWPFYAGSYRLPRS